jgi:hypothetical protein
MISLVGFFAQSCMSGTTQRECFLLAVTRVKLILVVSSVRAKLRERTDSHDAFGDYWIRCLYEGEEGDPEDVEKGFLKSRLLIKVRILRSTCKALTTRSRLSR